MKEEFRQDMPPTSGYRLFNWRRTYPKTLLPTTLIVGANAAMFVFCYFYNIKDWRRRRLTKFFEDRDVVNALEPFLLAERDRQLLRIIKRNTELEREVMKDVPGWKVGTWWGEPMFYTLGDNWIEPVALEANMHLNKNDWHKNGYWHQEGPWPDVS